MGRARVDMPKLRNQCRTCGERKGAECSFGFSVMCRRQSTKPCFNYRKPSVIEAANELAHAAGIDINSLKTENEDLGQ
ncbi:hypothetical protein FYJ45_24520 [Eisenbergiella tayi]|uniref:Uncharacterized protein n=1 Tax=Eisenbergiella porci TaxID=2652274 RepID=A0A6N7WKR4_9FIRM|nr:hypothetical protein [Eisenbergiella porci]MSS91283.1 hypothetical protein [Eisenbergiella porci]